MTGSQRIYLSDARGARIPARRFEGCGRGIALVLPGLNYLSDAPLMVAVRDVLTRHSEDVITVDYDYRQSKEFAVVSDDEKLSWLAADGLAYLGSAREQFRDGPVIVAGKSLGTMCMADIGELPSGSRMIWLTPSLKGTGLMDKIAVKGLPQFSLIGSCDGSVGITRSTEYLGIPNMTHVECPGLVHAWEHEDGQEAERLETEKAMALLDRWLMHH